MHTSWVSHFKKNGMVLAGRPATWKKHPHSRGGTVIEFALVAMAFFVLIFTVIDFSWIFYVQMNLQDTVRQAGRYASTGNHGTDSSGTALSRVASIDAQIRQNVIGAQIQTITISSLYGGSTTTNPPSASAAGGPNDVGTITVTANVPFLTRAIAKYFGSGTVYAFTATTSYRNEPFNFSQTN